MRLWSKQLIPVLPRQQLLGQWRECCLIAKNIAEKGTPNHILVNRIMHYPLEHFKSYTILVEHEMRIRGYKCDFGKIGQWLTGRIAVVDYDDLFYEWHNYRYLEQCYFNLQEKYDCGGITENEWKLIERTYYHC